MKGIVWIRQFAQSYDMDGPISINMNKVGDKMITSPDMSVPHILDRDDWE